MKKALVLVMVAFATSVFAIEPTNYRAIYKLNDQKTFNELIRYLNVDDTKADDLKFVFELTQSKMKSALKSNDEAKIEKVLFFNMGNAKYILSDKQFKEYLAALNLLVNTDKIDLLTQR